MKTRIQQLIIFILIAGIAFSCGTNSEEYSTTLVNNPLTADGKIDSASMPKFHFYETEHDFGRIIAGEKVSYSFKFKNTGKSDLLITNVSASCGCTIPEFSKKPIKPGDEGIISVTFDSKGRSGLQKKTVTVLANTLPNTLFLYIHAQIIETTE